MGMTGLVAVWGVEGESEEEGFNVMRLLVDGVFELMKRDVVREEVWVLKGKS